MFTLVVALAFHQAQSTDYRKDLKLLLDSLRDYGAYVNQDKIDFKALESAYEPKFAAVADKKQLLGLLESVVGELHDFHATLGANNDSSPRLVPSGTDIFAEWNGDRALVDQIRIGSLAEKAGIRAGDEVLKLNGQPIKVAAQSWLGIRKPDSRAWEWSLNSALAGRWDTPRNLTLKQDGRVRDISLATALQPKEKNLLTVEHRAGNVLYLRPENSLGDNGLIKEFDKAVLQMRTASKVVIDLRNTPGGGNTSVARGMMGLFIDKRLPYQRHRAEERETGTVRDWVEYATSRLSSPIKAPLYVLVGRWTGSMGEGIAIGFDALHRATVVGTKMARLRGAVDRLDLPQSGIGITFPTEQVFHINGTPRHLWLPPVLVKPGAGDPWMAAVQTEPKRHP